MSSCCVLLFVYHVSPKSVQLPLAIESEGKLTSRRLIGFSRSLSEIYTEYKAIYDRPKHIICQYYMSARAKPRRRDQNARAKQSGI